MSQLLPVVGWRGSGRFTPKADIQVQGVFVVF
jgi:hypothetical protein